MYQDEKWEGTLGIKVDKKRRVKGPLNDQEEEELEQQL